MGGPKKLIWRRHNVSTDDVSNRRFREHYTKVTINIMVNFNTDEAQRAINIAKRSLALGDVEKAVRFLKKAERLDPSFSQAVKDLLSDIVKNAPNGNAGKHTDNANGDTTRNRKLHDEHPKHEFTEDQLESVKRVKRCKDYYEILGVSRDCEEADLKKSYRKLALQFHPDKNHAPGATEAFKAIGNAYGVLSNPEKRHLYDQYGDENIQTSRHRRRRGHDSDSDEYDFTRGFEGDIPAEEIFNMFFGGGFPSGRVHIHNHRRRAHDYYYGNQQRQRRDEGGYTYLLQVLPILMLVMLSLFSSALVRDPPFKLTRNSQFTEKREVEKYRITYFVKKDFATAYRGKMLEVERLVVEEYVDNMRSNCWRERQYKESLLYKARYFGDKKLYQKAQEYTTPSCTRLEEVLGA